MLHQSLIFLAFCCLMVVARPNLLDGGDHSHDHHHDHDHAHDHSHDHAHDHSHDHAHEAKAETTTAKATSDVNDGGRLLALPEAQACANRPKQWERNGHWYFLSSNVTEYKDVKSDWLDARNLCRKHCMDAVSIETVEENDMILSVLEKEKLPYIWSSGRLCNFKGCDREDLQPLIVNGWFWSGSGVKLARTDEKPAGWTYQPWSATGHFKKPQPDNAEFEINQTSEACLGVLNNVYKDGIKWHDIGCYHTKAVICEDSPPLLQYIAATNPSLKL